MLACVEDRKQRSPRAAEATPSINNSHWCTLNLSPERHDRRLVHKTDEIERSAQITSTDYLGSVVPNIREYVHKILPSCHYQHGPRQWRVSLFRTSTTVIGLVYRNWYPTLTQQVSDSSIKVYGIHITLDLGNLRLLAEVQNGTALDKGQGQF
ncbi:hypothetical protein ACRALDRAFT_209944 [Sodiomyces alcalophilus JCM 7366]|uniref:uncharacterized protein n=1 Tax=Sodiomyces alcalophilus JCM 7366 TaxID=591952 RepID=UPI0039B65789